jgi:hypothetical protein
MSHLTMDRVPSREIAEELIRAESHLAGCLGGRVRELRLNFRDGGLVICGWTSTYYAKQLAQQAVMEISRRPIRANEIEVR